MPLKFNPVTGQLDLVSESGVKGPSSSTDNAITRWDGTTGQLIQDSFAILQDGGAIESQMFLTNKSVTRLVEVKANQSAICSDIELELTGTINLTSTSEVIIV